MTLSPKQDKAFREFLPFSSPVIHKATIISVFLKMAMAYRILSARQRTWTIFTLVMSRGVALRPLLKEALFMAIEKSRWTVHHTSWNKSGSYAGYQLSWISFSFQSIQNQTLLLAAYTDRHRAVFLFLPFLFLFTLHILFSFLHLLFWDHTLTHSFSKWGV